jgi:hypothetical protein
MASTRHDTFHHKHHQIFPPNHPGRSTNTLTLSCPCLGSSSTSVRQYVPDGEDGHVDVHDLRYNASIDALPLSARARFRYAWTGSKAWKLNGCIG